MTFLRSPKQIGSIRVLTMNLWQRYGAWADRRAVIIEGIRRIQPDLVAFAESIKTDDYDQAVDLLGSDFHVHHAKTRDPNGMGISVASRWTTTRVDEVNLTVSPRTEGFPCAALVAETQPPDSAGPLLFVNHFPNWQLDFEHERELQALATARLVEERVGKVEMPVIVAGDFDADPDATSVRFWSGRHSLSGISVCYRDAWESVHPNEPGPTFTPVNPLVKDGVVKGMQPFRDWPFRRIDYIFLRFGAHGGLAPDIVACERVFAEPVRGVWASDHFGLIAEFALPARNKQGP
jgi:endonuclease/exonuclease/phosphatase family metal-dependent hydrolase